MVVGIKKPKLKQTISKVLVSGVWKESGSTEKGINGIQVAMHIFISAAKIVLGKGGALRLVTGAIVVCGNKGEGVGGQADTTFIVGLRAEEGVEGGVPLGLKIED